MSSVYVYDIDSVCVYWYMLELTNTYLMYMCICICIWYVGSENIFLCSQGDRVALLLWLRHKHSGKDLLIANTHLSFPHTIFDKMSQVRQVQKLTEDIEAFTGQHGIRRGTQIILGR